MIKAAAKTMAAMIMGRENLKGRLGAFGFTCLGTGAGFFTGWGFGWGWGFGCGFGTAAGTGVGTGTASGSGWILQQAISGLVKIFSINSDSQR